MTQIPVPTGLCHSLMVADVHDSNSEDSISSPEAPQYSPISDTADNHPDVQNLTQNNCEDDEGP